MSDQSGRLPPLTCPHGKDKGHAGLGRAWCDAGIEGAKYLRDRAARVAAFRDKGSSTS